MFDKFAFLAQLHRRIYTGSWLGNVAFNHFPCCAFDCVSAKNEVMQSLEWEL